MMPAWLLRLLPPTGIALALLGALWWIDHRGYARAMAERDAHDARMLDALRGELRASEQRLAAAIDGIAGDYERQRETLARAAGALHPLILKEATDDPRLADPALGLTPGLLDAVNRARAAGACSATAAGRIDCALPAIAAGQGHGDR